MRARDEGHSTLGLSDVSRSCDRGGRIGLLLDLPHPGGPRDHCEIAGRERLGARTAGGRQALGRDLGGHNPGELRRQRADEASRPCRQEPRAPQSRGGRRPPQAAPRRAPRHRAGCERRRGPSRGRRRSAPCARGARARRRPPHASTSRRSEQCLRGGKCDGEVAAQVRRRGRQARQPARGRGR